MDYCHQLHPDLLRLISQLRHIEEQLHAHRGEPRDNQQPCQAQRYAALMHRERSWWKRLGILTNYVSIVAMIAVLAAAGCATASLQDGTEGHVTAGTTTVRAPQPSKEKQSQAKLNRLIAKHAEENGVPVTLAHAVITIESRYNPRARGQAGEIGLMQIKPATARGMGYQGSIKALYDPDTNLRWGMKYLGEAHRRGGGTVCGTILKYNAGHYAKGMNKVSAKYCGKVKRIMTTT